MKEVTFKQALNYPFSRPKGLTNVFWILVPIYGWAVVYGYLIQVINEMLKGKFKELPKMKHEACADLGFRMFFKSIPFMIVYAIVNQLVASLGQSPDFYMNLGFYLSLFIQFFVVPVMTMHFYKKQTVASYFEFGILKGIFKQPVDYLRVLLHTFLLNIIFGFLTIVLVGIPASLFANNIFFADFYRRNIQ